LGIRRIILDGPNVWLEAEVVAKNARCPSCQTPSSHVHDRYRRRPVDLPWRGRTAHLCVRVRRFRCLNSACQRSTFAEDCGQTLPRYARRTKEVSDTLLQIALIVGGEAGARVAAKHGLPTSPDTLLRLVRRQPQPITSTPTILGIDDLALRRRQSYATIFVDLETHRPIDLVEGREAEVVANWLKVRSGVKVIVRDRSGAYADGARAGAPKAQQVADRFHLVQNASTALDELLRSRKRQTEYLETSQSVSQLCTSESTAESTVSALPPTSAKLSPTKQRQAERRQARVGRWQKVKEMREAGQNVSQIARAFGMCRRTVRHYLATEEPVRNNVEHPRLGGLKSPMLQPFVPYLQARWEAGCHNVAQLLREIQARGYIGSRTLLVDSLKPWRPPRLSRRQKRLHSRKSVRWLVLRPPETLKPDEKVVLDQFLVKNPEIALGYDLVQRFREVVADRDLEALETWLCDAKHSKLATFVGLANGIEADRAAVNAALELPWSNGPVEGHVNRVKLIKRQGYGRANFDLLRARVLAA
jgi:transposase